MAADRDEPEADVSEQQEPVTDVSVEDPFEALEDLGERPEADTLEQAIPVDEDQILNPAPRRCGSLRRRLDRAIDRSTTG